MRTPPLPKGNVPARPAWRGTAGLMAGLIALLAAGAGCQAQRSSDSLAAFTEARAAKRIRSLLWTAEMLVRQEQRKGEQLGRTVELFERGIREDMLQTERNLRMLDYYLRREFERFGERMPLYQREAGRLLGGRLQNIPRNAVILFL